MASAPGAAAAARPLRVLFVCSMNQRRSRTAEDMYCGTPGLEVSSAGTWPQADHPVQSDDLDWADLILVMEQEHRPDLETVFGSQALRGKLTVLGIPDLWYRDDPALQQKLRASIDHLLALSANQRA